MEGGSTLCDSHRLQSELDPTESAVWFGRFSKTSLTTGRAENAFGQLAWKAMCIMTSEASDWVRPLSIARLR
jgi:hypothetical protein